MCWSFLAGTQVECDHHQLIPGPNANPSLLAFIFSSFRKSQILCSMPEKLGMQLIVSDSHDTSNILFLDPFYSSSPKIIWQKIVYNLYGFCCLSLETYCLFHQYHSFIRKLHLFIYVNDQLIIVSSMCLN